MTIQMLAELLIDETEMSNSTRFLDELMCKARNAILAGNGTIGSLTASSINGKNFTKTADMNPAEVLKACHMALDEIDGTGKNVAASYADFREIRR
jgi:uncharacterized protein (UPF0264 family)